MVLARKNINVVAALMVLTNHVKEDLLCIQENSILALSEKNFIPCITHPKQQGVYAYYHTNRGGFIQSRKVTRHGFDARGNEHEKGAREEMAASNFNLVYPSKLIERSNIGV